VKDERLYLRHILDAAEKAARYTAIGRDAFMANEQCQDAVVRQMEIIGEAASQLGKFSKGFFAKHAHVHWQKIVSFRNLLIHEYFGVELPVVWDISQDDLPVLKRQVQEILDNWETPPNT
jgi:uncharacterized protein with HEPN domain